MTAPLRVAPEAEDGADNLSKAGAVELACRLQAYWTARGAHNVRHWVEAAHDPGNGRCATWTIRSNLINGLPPRQGGRK
jgi:hypothetical protein